MNSFKHSLRRPDPLLRKTKLPLQDPAEFSEDDFADNQLMLGQDSSKNVGAEPPSRECGDENICIETDSQEMSRKMSSSVR